MCAKHAEAARVYQANLRKRRAETGNCYNCNAELPLWRLEKKNRYCLECAQVLAEKERYRRSGELR
jgi:predicted amidophosphoribosyltransferase